MHAIGRYSILEKIASGGMSQIYKGILKGPQGFKKEVVLKNITELHSFSKHLIHEAKILSSFQHPNVVSVYELVEEKKNFFLVMEYIQGQDLDELNSSKMCLSEKVHFYLVSEILKGLEYIHEKGFIHQDLSPSNILISYDGYVKITDFGLAVKKNERTTRSLYGKCSYLSPEQVRGENITFQTDLFSLGLILYEMLRGKKFFEGKTDFEILEKIRKFKTIEEKINSQVDSFLKNLLQQSPCKRFQSAQECLEFIQGHFQIASREEFLKEIQEGPQKTHKLSFVRDMPQKNAFLKHYVIGVCIFFILLGGVSFHYFYNSGSGFLSIQTEPWSYVTIQGEKLMTPLYHYKIKSGRVSVIFENPHLNQKKSKTVWVRRNGNTLILDKF
ncbi:MAG: serine/threonine protein kinase [Deltaproteobacteria bacterium]|nr:serine/threonine protein kinase [Deltaproteobacteria bacterium]